MSDRYVLDDDVLPDELVAKCRAKLDRYAVVSVRASGPLNPSESALGEELALLVRGAAPGLRVYFHCSKRADAAQEKVAAVQWLLAERHTTQAIADALGMHQPSVAKMGASAFQRGQPVPLPPDNPAAWELGFAVLDKRYKLTGILPIPETYDGRAARLAAAAADGQSATQMRRRALRAGHVLLALRHATSAEAGKDAAAQESTV